MVIASSGNIDLSGSVGSRVTPWTGQTRGGAADSTDAVEIDCGAAVGGTISRSFTYNYEAKQAYVLSEELPGDLPQAYWYMAQNAPSCPEGDPWPPEDVPGWAHAWATVSLWCPAGVALTDVVTLTLTYQFVASVSDNHYPDATRLADYEVTLSDLRTVTYALTGLYPGANAVPVCLMLPTTGEPSPRLELVRSAALAFPAQTAASTWKLTGFELSLDPEANAGHIGAHMGEDWRHSVKPGESGRGVSGGIRVRIDQNSGAVCPTDRFQMWELERVLPAIAWVISNFKNVYLEHAWTLRKFCEHLSNLRTGFSVALTSTQWTDWYNDEEDGASYDIAPQWSCGDTLKIAFRGGGLSPVPALTYKPYIGLCVGGGLEGLVYRGTALQRSKPSVVKVTRESTGAPVAMETLSSDATAMVLAGFYQEAYDYTQVTRDELHPPETQWNPDRYDYFVNGFSRGALYRRQVVFGDWLAAAIGTGGTMLWRDRHGRLWRADSDGATITAQYRVSAPATWSAPVTVASGDYAQPGGEDPGDGFQMIAAIDNATGDKYQWHTEDVAGADWVADGEIT